MHLLNILQRRLHQNTLALTIIAISENHDVSPGSVSSEVHYSPEKIKSKQCVLFVKKVKCEKFHRGQNKTIDKGVGSTNIHCYLLYKLIFSSFYAIPMC